MKTVKPSFIALLHSVFPQRIINFFLAPINCPHKQNIIISDMSFLKMSVYHVNCTEFLVLTHNIPEMIVFHKRNSTNNVMFLKCRVALRLVPLSQPSVFKQCCHTLANWGAKVNGRRKLYVGKPPKYTLQILVVSHHIILFASFCIVWCFRVVLLVLLYVVISVFLLLFSVHKACTMNFAMLHPTKPGHFRKDIRLLKKWEESNWEMEQHS